MTIFVWGFVVWKSSNNIALLQFCLLTGNCKVHFKIFTLIFFFAGDQELVSFLQEEIAAEKKNLTPKVPAMLDDFSVKPLLSQLVLTKKFHDEE